VQQQHDIYSDSYEIMYNDIALNMTLGKSSHRMFNNDSEFIKYLKYKMDQLIDRAPPITNYIRKKYEKNNPAPTRWRRSREQSPMLSKSTTQLHMQLAINTAAADAAAAAAAAAAASAASAVAVDADIYAYAPPPPPPPVAMSPPSMTSTHPSELPQRQQVAEQQQRPRVQRPATIDDDDYEDERSPPLARSVYSSQAPTAGTSAPAGTARKTQSSTMATPYCSTFVYAPPLLQVAQPTQQQQQQQLNEIQAETNPIFEAQLYRARSKTSTNEIMTGPSHPHPLQAGGVGGGRPWPRPGYASS